MSAAMKRADEQRQLDDEKMDRKKEMEMLQLTKQNRYVHTHD